MNFDEIASRMTEHEGVEISTMMGSPCLRYHGEFMTMMFDKADSLIVKVSADRVNELIEEGVGNEFNYTGKRFKEWVLIPLEFEDQYPDLVYEAMMYAKGKIGK